MSANVAQLSENRTRTLKLNALLSVFFRVTAMFLGMLIIPMAINFVNSDQFGIWLTISSIVAWCSLFDVGLSNGLRNKLTIALSVNEKELCKVYVSTTYVLLFVVFFSLWIFFLPFNYLISWSSILNISSQNEESLKLVMLIVFTYFCISFLLKTINVILLAYQKAAYSSFIELIGQALTLGAIYIMTLWLKGSLLTLSLALCTIPLLVFLLFNIILFSGKFKEIAPSIKYFKKSCVNDLMGLSVKFFVIQTAAIIQYQTANIIIARYFDMTEVTNYNIVFKYFNVLNVVFGMLLLPLWSASTDAYNKGDYEWIRSMIFKYMKIFTLAILVGVFMLFISSYVYDIWLGEGVVVIPFILSLWGFIYFCVSMFGAVYVNVLNGIGAIRIQFLLSMFTPLLYIGLCIGMINGLGWGIYTVFIAAILANINGFLIAPIQFWKLFVQKKKGIWST